ncbi:MAG TPA: nuclear transport factor 2 family protein [Verrucomicrobiota bacterium]|nr:nuclear transport factor 2 family protein [Verrucomicrobiota bacterium]
MKASRRFNARWLVNSGALACLILADTGCVNAPVSRSPASSAEAQIKTVLQNQVLAWNSGDLIGFMDGYARLDTTRFVSGGTVTQGWQTVFDRYRARYTNAATMGHVVFSEVQVEMLSADAGFVTGAWQLARTGDAPSGRFTLLFRRLSGGWRIVYDHTSAAEP